LSSASSAEQSISVILGRALAQLSESTSGENIKRKRALIRRVFSEEPGSLASSSADVPPAPGDAGLTSAEAVQLVGGLVSPPEPPPLFLSEITGSPESELGQDLCAMLEGLAGAGPSAVEEAVSPAVEDSAASGWNHVPEGTVTRIVRRLVFSVTSVPFFPLEDLTREFPECPRSLLSEIRAGFIPEEEDEED